VAFLFQNPRSGWKHKAWGEAKAEPQDEEGKKTERAKRATAQKLLSTYDEPLSPTSWALTLSPSHPGVRSASPRLYAIAALRGLRRKSHLPTFISPFASPQRAEYNSVTRTQPNQRRYA
jgi:hypothetical protein